MYRWGNTELISVSAVRESDALRPLRCQSVKGVLKGHGILARIISSTLALIFSIKTSDLIYKNLFSQ